jgi:hypothetical protein
MNMLLQRVSNRAEKRIDCTKGLNILTNFEQRRKFSFFRNFNVDRSELEKIVDMITVRKAYLIWRKQYLAKK